MDLSQSLFLSVDPTDRFLFSFPSATHIRLNIFNDLKTYQKRIIFSIIRLHALKFLSFSMIRSVERKLETKSELETIWSVGAGRQKSADYLES